jgi:hypothetical protein
LRVNGTHSNAGAYAVQANGSLGGAGVITLASGNNVTVTGNVSPGSGASMAGELTLNTSGGGVTELAQGGSYTWEINNDSGTAGTNWDLLSLDAVTISAGAGGFTIRVTSLPGINWTNNIGNATFPIATGAAGSFTEALLEKFVINTDDFAPDNLGGFYLTVNEAGDTLSLVYVPEPGSAAVMIGAAGAGMMRRRRRK